MVSVGVHQKGPAWLAVAPRTADFLVVAFERTGQASMNNGPNVGLVDSHAESDGCDHNFKFTGLESGLHTFARRCVKAGVIRRGGH